MVRCLERVSAFLYYLKGRSFGAAALALILSAAVCKAALELKIVSVREGKDVTVVYTTQEDPGRILKENGIEVAAQDAVEFSGIDGMLAEISITRAYPVTLVADGRAVPLMITQGTVGDLLIQAGMMLGEEDQISHPLEQPVTENDIITVTRMEQQTIEEREEVPYEVRTVRSPQVGPGEQQLLEEGENGLRVETYSQTTVDGEVVERTMVSDLLVKPPVDETWLEGFPAQAVSPFDFEWEFDEDGEPVEYKQVLRSARAAGYSAKPGAGTASGRPAVVGNVAVDPRVIPYGSKLYIESVGGDFVYGYAVAADTGTAMVQGLCEVDLFYDTYAESARNGIRTVNIYILE